MLQRIVFSVEKFAATSHRIVYMSCFLKNLQIRVNSIGKVKYILFDYMVYHIAWREAEFFLKAPGKIGGT